MVSVGSWGGIRVIDSWYSMDCRCNRDFMSSMEYRFSRACRFSIGRRTSTQYYTYTVGVVGTL